MNSTIAALSTPPGEGAIAVIRISGPEATFIATALFQGARPPFEPRERHLHFGVFHEAGQKLDEGLLAIFRAPKSYTGEDMAELHCHGGTLVSSAVFAAVLRAGARAAAPGEFSQRAFLNGKMDLTQAEAVMDVIRASTPRALRAAQEQLEGRLGQAVETIRHDLLAVVAHLEAYIDFPEEGIDPHVGTQLAADLSRVSQKITDLLGTADEGRILREGVRLVLCGAPNAGKSSLLNRLLGYERAIVSPVAGTTRDTVEEMASLKGIAFRIIDTAGLRDTDDQVERAGVQRTRHAMEQADVIVRVLDPFAPSLAGAGADEIVALNKIDLLSGTGSLPPGEIPISCLTGEGIDQLVEAIVARTSHQAATEAPSLVAINARHQVCLERAHAELTQAQMELTANAAPEIVAVSLRAALDAVSEVTGATDIEDILGEIFSTFCIGK